MLIAVSRGAAAQDRVVQGADGRTLPWYSSFGSDFNYDFHVTLDDAVIPVVYNYRTKAQFAGAGTPIDFEQPFELPG